MKKIFLISALLAGVIVAQAQVKLGHLNSNELLALMPESISMQEDLQTYAKGLESQLTAMQAEYESKVAEYQQNESTFSDIVKEDKIREVESIQQRILEFQKSAQQSLSEKELELFTPIRDKATNAIQEVAKEAGFTYVFDLGAGSLLYVNESQDILPLVKAKLGL
jgi:outer membrane protein